VRALTVIPAKANSLELGDVPEPEAHEGDVLVDVVAVGICGTDAEIMGGEYGEAPPGHDRLVLGHESLGRVREAPSGSRLAAGDLVACIVRCPDPVAFTARLRTGSPAVFCRTNDDHVLLDARTITDQQVPHVARAVLYALEGDDLDDED